MNDPQPVLYYAVYLFPTALETLGDALKPYLRDGPHGRHLMCAEIDAGGQLFEVMIPSHDEQGRPIDIEMMFPTVMVRLVISMRPEADVGFT
ncbi:MAG TPA: hypothetical protein VND91_04275 [Candidatus Saccharimonadia bacterium]|nr:hypothetical protein [Candidatus Saccharimonadia bacterium]